MKLSEAIRLGAMLKPQAFHALRKGGKSCALGAACDAVGIAMHSSAELSQHALFVEFQHLHAAAKCPACSRLNGWWRRLHNQEYDLKDVIIHLNDDHDWTRERIADWVATVEPADQTQPQIETPALITA